MTEGHGDDIYRYGDRVIINFSSNIFGRVNHSGLLKYLYDRGEDILHYPDPVCNSLESRIAGTLSVSSDKVMVTNGVTECIYMLAQAFSGKKTAILVPAFREYQDACNMYGVDVCFVDTLDNVPEDVDSVWICSPSNPEGKVVDHSLLLEFITAREKCVVIVDQAYADYTSEQVLSPAECVQAGNVVMLLSFTKRFAVPGLRIGYAVGAVSLIEPLRKPWSVNCMAMAAAEYLLAHRGEYLIDAVTLHSEALRISGAFRNLGIDVSDTDCNFVLCKLPFGTAGQLKEFLLSEYGILIRDASNFETLTPAHFRVAAQTAVENDLLIKGVERWIGAKR